MFGGFAKIELAKLGDEAIAGVLDHGTGKFGSEPFFVPAHPDLSHCDGETCRRPQSGSQALKASGMCRPSCCCSRMAFDA